jgi:hypothetical protein
MTIIARTRWTRALRDGRPTVRIACPKCLTSGDLDAHDIDDDGNVSPSVVCPSAICDFHDTIKLEWFYGGSIPAHPIRAQQSRARKQASDQNRDRYGAGESP